jgi:hypothetical protein
MIDPINPYPDPKPPVLTADQRAGGRIRHIQPIPNRHPTTITLTEDQNQALQAMLAFEKNKSAPAMVLTGAAGTGKTTVLQHYIHRTRRRVILTAPTNKAVRVLAEMASAHHTTVTCCTIHKLLGLVLKSDSEERYCGSTHKETLEVFDVLIVDECSMVGNRPTHTPQGEVPGLFDTLMDRIERWGRQYNRRIKVIFVGDPCQLPPVKEGYLSPTFEAGPKIHLNKVVRQALDNPIIRLATYLRDRLEDHPSPRPLLEDDDFFGVCALQDRRDFEDLILCAYEDEPAHPTRYKVLAFRNNTVDRYNDLVRAEIYGQTPARWVEGERYVATQPIIEWRPSNSDGFGVPSYYPVTHASTDEDATLQEIEGDTKIKGFEKYRAVRLRLQGYDHEFTANVPHPADEDRWLQDLRDLQTRAKLPPGTPRRVPWSRYWALHDAFAHLRPHYAMTCHRSQGSTYENVFVDAQDILSHPSGSWEGLRCLYTAVTRASKMVYILE